MAVNRSDRFTQTDRKNQIYSDFLVDLNPHPASGDIVRFVNENAVVRSCKNLLLTNKGERLYQPDVGSDITRILFEPIGYATADMLSQFIQDTIDTYEPRAKVLSVEATPNFDMNAYGVTIIIMVINKQDPVSFNVTLNRVR